METSSSSFTDLKIVKKPFAMGQMKPLMLLKDFLLDDFSSCSSNGFKSFPRKQQRCTSTSVRFLLDIDLNNNNSRTRDLKNGFFTKRIFNRGRSVSVLQKASGVVLSAVKLLTFTSVKSRKGFLTKSFSQKMLKRRFWKRSEGGGGEIQRLRSFREFLEEKELPSDSITVTTNTTTTTGATTSNSNSWSGSEFASDYLHLSRRNSDCYSGENDVVGGNNKKKSPEKNKKHRTTLGVDSGEDSTEAAVEPKVKKGWPAEEEKEQFSPVSVLDCPFDDEEETCPPFQHRLPQLEGKKKKLMQKMKRFENLTQLQPVDLQERITMSESPSTDTTTTTFIEIEKELEAEQEAEGLLKIIKAKFPSNTLSKLKSDKLFLDFFKDRIEKSDQENNVVKVVEDWINGKPNKVLLDWQVREGRKAYIKDMEEGGEWRREMDDERREAGLDVEVRIWSSLVDELLFEVIL